MPSPGAEGGDLRALWRKSFSTGLAVPARRQLFHATEPAPARPILLRRRDLTGEHRACKARHILARDSEANDNDARAA